MPSMQAKATTPGSPRPTTLARFARITAACLLAYGALTIFLQTEVFTKLLRGTMGYGGWLWGGPLSDLPTAWAAPTTIEEPVRALYSILTLRQPLLPWLAWVAGCLALLAQKSRVQSPGSKVEGHASRFTFHVSRSPSSILLLLLALSALAIGAWLRAANLLPSVGRVPGSNFDEMVYYTQSELWTRGAWPYGDTFMAHPPGVAWAIAPGLIFERAWGGLGAFVAARQWLFAYSLLAIPLAWAAALRLGGPVSAAVTAFVLALDGKAAFAPQSDRRLPNVGVLETLVNVTSLAALLLYLYAPLDARARRLWLLGAGAVAGISALCKIPGAALLLALVLYSLGLRRVREAGLLLVGALAGAGLFALPFVIVAPGQMIRQAIFFQLLRPQEVREGIDQAGRIASYPEAQLTLLLAGLGIVLITALLWRGGQSAAWALPVLWAAPILAVFVLGRSYHSQYYTQWAPPLALCAGALAAKQLWRRVTPARVAPAVLLAAIALPLAISQWRVASASTYDETYVPAAAILSKSLKPGETALAYDPGYTFLAAIPPARIPLEGDYLADTAGYTVYTAADIDRRPWGDLLRGAATFSRERNEEDLLRQPEAQAALLAGAVGSDLAVLDQKIALPKLTAQSVRLLEALAQSRQQAGLADVLHLNRPAATPFPPFPLSLNASTVARLDDKLEAVANNDTLNVKPGDAIQAGLYWRPTGYIAPNLHVVARLVDANGVNVTQTDTEPSEGADHTSNWRPGFIYPDIRNIPLDAVRPGIYRLLIHLYDPATNATTGDVILPQTVEVK
jgi:hypothetical protein